MGAVLPRSMKLLSEATDPKAALIKAVGAYALAAVNPFGAQLLGGTYIEPEKSVGGIIITQRSVQESLYQGCLALVLKGPWAFVDDEDLNIHWKGQDVDVGEWVIFKYSDAWEQHLNGVSIRFIDDRDIRGTVSDPTILTSRPNDVAAA